MKYEISINKELLKSANKKELDIDQICSDAIMAATQKEDEIVNAKAFFESEIWKTDLAERIINDLGKALPVSNLIKNRYGFDISTTMLMKKAKELQDLKPKRERPKIKGKIK